MSEQGDPKETVKWMFGEVEEPQLSWVERQLTALEGNFLARLNIPRRRQAWLSGRWAVKRLLEVARGIQPNQLSVLADEDGSVRLLDAQGERLNGSVSLSHSQSAVLCAYSPDMRVGVDLERVTGRNLNHFRGFFHPTMLDWLEKMAEGEKNQAATLLWCCLESAFKAQSLPVSALNCLTLADPDGYEKDMPSGAAWQPLFLQADQRRLCFQWRKQGNWVMVIHLQSGVRADLQRIFPLEE